MMQKYCCETGKDWDEGLPFMLFAIRDTKEELLGFRPAELVFGQNVHGPLKVLQKFMTSSPSKTNVLDFVSQCRLHSATST